MRSEAYSIDQRKIDHAVKLGLMPSEVCELFGMDMPFDILAPIYRKHFSSYDDLLKKFNKRLYKAGLLKKPRTLRNKISQRLRGQIADMIMREMGSLEELIGYSLDDLMDHLESQFKDGINWDNINKWHIDHINPRSNFTTKQIKQCFQLSNLRPLWAIENIRKGRKLVE